MIIREKCRLVNFILGKFKNLSEFYQSKNI
jgi:hypothetical protein